MHVYEVTPGIYKQQNESGYFCGMTLTFLEWHNHTSSNDAHLKQQSAVFVYVVIYLNLMELTHHDG